MDCGLGYRAIARWAPSFVQKMGLQFCNKIDFSSMGRKFIFGTDSQILTYPEGQLYCFLSLNKDKIWFAALYKRRHFENTNLLAGNNHVIDVFTSEDMGNIHCVLYNK